jgi:hypothetical protein
VSRKDVPAYREQKRRGVGSVGPLVDGVLEERVADRTAIFANRIQVELVPAHFPSVVSDALRKEELARCRAEECDLVPIDSDRAVRKAGARRRRDVVARPSEFESRYRAFAFGGYLYPGSLELLRSGTTGRGLGTADVPAELSAVTDAVSCAYPDPPHAERTTTANPIAHTRAAIGADRTR